jgi:hypothetical protein
MESEDYRSLNEEEQVVQAHEAEWQKGDDDKKTLAHFTKVFQQMVDCCNGGDQWNIVKAFCNVMVVTHRTLQQQMIGMLVRCIVDYSKEYDKVWHGNTDARNQAAIEFCRKLAEQSIYFPYI